MVSQRLRAALSTLLLVVGALLVGDALHGGVVTGQYGVTTPAFVLRILIGVPAIAGGYELRTPVDQYVAMPSDETSTSDPETGGSTEFDPELSPVGGEHEAGEWTDEQVDTPQGGGASDGESTNGDDDAKRSAEDGGSDGRDDRRSVE